MEMEWKQVADFTQDLLRITSNKMRKKGKITRHSST